MIIVPRQHLETDDRFATASPHLIVIQHAHNPPQASGCASPRPGDVSPGPASPSVVGPGRPGGRVSRRIQQSVSRPPDRGRLQRSHLHAAPALLRFKARGDVVTSQAVNDAQDEGEVGPARNAQNQERLTKRLADHLQRQLTPYGVGVVIEAEHTCMSLRGARLAGARPVTSALLGQRRDDPASRAGFLSLARPLRGAR